MDYPHFQQEIHLQVVDAALSCYFFGGNSFVEKLLDGEKLRIFFRLVEVYLDHGG